MKRIIRTLLAVLALLATALASAQTVETRQNLDALRVQVEKFLEAQSAGMPGKIDITVTPIDSRLSIGSCPAPEAFFPPGKRAWGKTTVAVRCTEPAKWTIYVKATVKVMGEYVVAAAPLSQGQLIAQKDLAKMTGDLASLPRGAITNPADAVGQKLATSIALGAPIKKELLRSQQAVLPGQMVRLVSQGSGFRISTEGRALSSAYEGQLVQTRTASGQTVSGIARMGGIVEVSF